MKYASRVPLTIAALLPTAAHAENAFDERPRTTLRLEAGSGVAVPTTCDATGSVRHGVGPALSLGLLAVPTPWFDVGLGSRWARTSCGTKDGDEAEFTFRTVGVDARATLVTAVIQPMLLLDIGWMYEGVRHPGVYMCYAGGHQVYGSVGLGAAHRASSKVTLGFTARYVAVPGQLNCLPPPEATVLPWIDAKPHFLELRLTIQHKLF